MGSRSWTLHLPDQKGGAGSPAGHLVTECGQGLPSLVHFLGLAEMKLSDFFNEGRAGSLFILSHFFLCASLCQRVSSGFWEVGFHGSVGVLRPKEKFTSV